MLTIGHILAALTGYRISGHEPRLTSVEVDSRSIQPGGLFVAFPGERVDGHDFVADAFERGAIAALIQRPVAGFQQIEAGTAVDAVPELPFYLRVEDTERALQQVARTWRTQFADLNVIGITGSIGKTSTKELTHAVLSQRFTTLKTPKNYNNEIGLPLTVLQLTDRYSHAVLEMGMYDRGEIALLCDIARPKIGVVTNIGPVHLSRLGTMEAIVAAKRELVESLPADGVAILNRDDAFVMSMAPATRARVFTYGLTPEADLWASDVDSFGLDGIHFTLHQGEESWRLQVPLLGRHSVHTALRATAVAQACGLTWEEIIRGLQVQQSQLRLVTVRGPRNSLILDDTYNASPDSVIAALNLLDDLDGRKIAVLGDMLELGSAEEAGHRRVGRRALEVADLLVVVGERGRIIGEEALLAGMPAPQVFLTRDTAEASALLTSLIQRDDIVLVKGSLGAHLDQIVNTLSRTLDNVEAD